jgi:hypothetical protein
MCEEADRHMKEHKTSRSIREKDALVHNPRRRTQEALSKTGVSPVGGSDRAEGSESDHPFNYRVHGALSLISLNAGRTVQSFTAGLTSMCPASFDNMELFILSSSMPFQRINRLVT